MKRDTLCLSLLLFFFATSEQAMLLLYGLALSRSRSLPYAAQTRVSMHLTTPSPNAPVLVALALLRLLPRALLGLGALSQSLPATQARILAAPAFAALVVCRRARAGHAAEARTAPR